MLFEENMKKCGGREVCKENKVVCVVKKSKEAGMAGKVVPTGLRNYGIQRVGSYVHTHGYVSVLRTYKWSRTLVLSLD